MSKKNILIIVIAVIALIIIIPSSMVLSSFLSCKAEKRAIIIIPGLFASGLYDTATGEYVWDPFEELELNFGDFLNKDGININKILPLLKEKCVIAELNKLLANSNYGAPDSLFNMIAMNEDSTPKVPTVKPVPWTDASRLKYGVINAQKDMYESLNERYGGNYEVQVFNYDFRMDSRYNGELLEKYINSKGYTDIILVSHSNGGEVSACYLARSEENRKKITKYISYDSPYYGSYSAITILENLDGMLGGLQDTLSSVPALANNIQELFDKQFKPLVNMWTVYQLLPSYELMTQEYNGETCGIYVDGQKLVFSSQEDIWNFYCSRPWAKINGELRIGMKQWLDFRDSMFVKLEDGSKVLSTTLVDTTYFTGENCQSDNSVYFTTNQDNTLTLTSTSKTAHGDGTVLYTSAVAFEKDTSKISFFDGVDHYGVCYAYRETAQEKTYAVIDKALKEKYSAIDRLWFYKNLKTKL